MGRRKNAAHKSARMPVTRGLALRSRVPGNWHARFCSRDGGSDSLVDCNRTGDQRCCVARWPHQRCVVVLPPAVEREC
jgi:hypothetical protein